MNINLLLIGIVLLACTGPKNKPQKATGANALLNFVYLLAADMGNYDSKEKPELFKKSRSASNGC